MEQSHSDIRQLLQRQVFTHASIRRFNPYSQAVLKKLSLCHTAGIGVHEYRCDNSSCHNRHYQYHCCGNRHCMNCGGMKREQWIQDRMNELLPTTYYHIVFTLPQELRSLCMGNRKVMFNLLFEASHAALTTLAADSKWLGGQPGIVSILHTNGQELTFHPHVHCIVSGGGIDANGKWIKEKRANGRFMFPQKLLSDAFKSYFLKQLGRLYTKQVLRIEDTAAYQQMVDKVATLRWNVYAKAPFTSTSSVLGGGPAQIVEYLGRYTHKVAITAHRVTEIANNTITFKYKDYADGDKVKLMTLSQEEFLRRFEQNILPQRFVKIRHAGYLSHRNKGKRIAAILEQLRLPAPKPRVKIPILLLVLMKSGTDLSICPKCNVGKLVLQATYINVHGKLVDVSTFRSRGSPPVTPAS